MKILVTGANGYIGRRLVPALKQAGHEVVALVRDKRRTSDVAIEGDLYHHKPMGYSACLEEALR